MFCVIPHVSKYAKDHSDRDHRKQVNNVIKTLFRGLSEDGMAVNQDIFWTECKEFYNKIASFDGDEFIWKIKNIRDVNSHLWHQKYSLPWKKVIGFVTCRFISKVLGIGEAERSLGDVKTIRSGKDLLSSVMYHRNIVLLIHLPVSNQLKLNNSILTNNLMKTVQVIPGMKMMMILIKN